jgi:hypothetical protein
LGSNHDGETAALDCPASDGYIMGSGAGKYIYQFSTCSLRQMKALLIDTSTGNVTNNGICLLNVPSVNDLSASQIYLNQYQYPGLQLFNPDDQCELQFGSNSTFCRVIIFFFLCTRYLI